MLHIIQKGIDCWEIYNIWRNVEERPRNERSSECHKKIWMIVYGTLHAEYYDIAIGQFGVFSKNMDNNNFYVVKYNDVVTARDEVVMEIKMFIVLRKFIFQVSLSKS